MSQLQNFLTTFSRCVALKNPLSQPSLTRPARDATRKITQPTQDYRVTL